MDSKKEGSDHISSELSHIVLVVAQNWVASDGMSSVVQAVAEEHGHVPSSVRCICGCRYDRNAVLEKCPVTLVYSVETIRERDDSGVKHTVDLKYPEAAERNIPVIYDGDLKALEKFFRELPKKPGENG